MTIYEVGGTVERADGSMNTLLVNEPPLLRVGTEWVLFLRWHDRLNGFVIDHGHHGAFQIVAERIQPASRDEWLDSWRGRSLQVFMEGLKPFVHR